jgi:hypothetical protein
LQIPNYDPVLVLQLEKGRKSHYLAIVLITFFNLFFFFFCRPNKVKFVIDAQAYESTPKPIPGDVVTFSYQHYTKLLTPVNPKIERIRGDLSWQEILHNYKNEILHPQILNGIPPPPSLHVPLCISTFHSSSPPFPPSLSHYSLVP